MAKVGRPPKIKSSDLPELVEKFKRYIAETDLPIIAEFAYKNEINRQILYDREEFSTLLKIAVQKKEAMLERKTLTGEYNPTMAVFSLKQLGWRDKHEHEHMGGLTIKVGLPTAPAGEEDGND